MLGLDSVGVLLLTELLVPIDFRRPGFLDLLSSKYGVVLFSLVTVLADLDSKVSCVPVDSCVVAVAALVVSCSVLWLVLICLEKAPVVL